MQNFAILQLLLLASALSTVAAIICMEQPDFDQVNAFHQNVADQHYATLEALKAAGYEALHSTLNVNCQKACIHASGCSLKPAGLSAENDALIGEMYMNLDMRGCFEANDSCPTFQETFGCTACSTCDHGDWCNAPVGWIPPKLDPVTTTTPDHPDPRTDPRIDPRTTPKPNPKTPKPEQPTTPKVEKPEDPVQPSATATATATAGSPMANGGIILLVSLMTIFELAHHNIWL